MWCVCVCMCVCVCVWMKGCWVVLYIMMSTIRAPRWPVLTCLLFALPAPLLSPPPLSLTHLSLSPTAQVEKETRSEAHVKSRLRQSIDEVTEMPDVEDYILQKKEMCVPAHHFCLLDNSLLGPPLVPCQPRRRSSLPCPPSFLPPDLSLTTPRHPCRRTPSW